MIKAVTKKKKKKLCFRKGAVSIDLTESQRRHRPSDKQSGYAMYSPKTDC